MHGITKVLATGLVSLGMGAPLWFLCRGEDAPRSRTRRTAAPSPLAEEASTGSGEGEAEAAERVAALWGEMVALRRDMQVLKAEMSRLTGTSVAAEPVRKSATAPPPGDEEEENDKQQAMIAKVREAFLAEPSDAYWSSARRSSIRELTDGNPALRHAVRAVDCRSRTCRVELRDDASANLGENLPLFVSELTPTLPVVTTDWMKAPDGTGTYVLYMSGS